MAINKPSSFGAAEGIIIHANTHQENTEDSTKNIQIKREIGKTQGRKGFKLKRLNLALSDDNYIFVKEEAEKLGISQAAVVNSILDQFRK